MTLAFLVFSLFAFVPGYVAGWICDVCEFRRGSLLRQVTLSTPLSLAITPILAYLPWRFFSVHAVLWMFGIGGAAFAVIAVAQLARRGFRVRDKSAWALGSGLTAAWILAALVLLPDMRVGNRLYYSSAAYDYLSRIPIASQFSRQEKLPAVNPYLNPGYAAPLRYHYFWPMVCGLARRASGNAFTASEATLAGTLWAGIGLLSIIALYVRLFQGHGPGEIKRYVLTFSLLAVTGLDLIPALLFAWVHRDAHVFFASIEWWNEQIPSWAVVMLWVPHHAAALVAGLLVFLMLWRESEQRIPTMLLAALALASSAGLSIYVTLVFAAILIVWAIALWSEGQRSTVYAIAAAGLASLAMAAPFFLELLSPGDPGKALVIFKIREFYALQEYLRGYGMTPGVYAFVCGLLKFYFLPLNYGLELGAYLYAGVLWWKFLRRDGNPRQNKAAILMLVTSALIATFLCSQAGANDLGFRGCLPAQTILLLWTADVLSRWDIWKVSQRRILAVLLAIGVASTTADMALLRFYTLLLDSKTLALNDWKIVAQPDRQLGERNMALSEAYAWIRSHTPENAVVQANPVRTAFQFGLYAERPGLAMGADCAGYSGREGECHAIRVALLPLFYRDEGSLHYTCRQFPLAIVVVDDSDPAWTHPHGWVWTAHPVFANQRARVFACPQ